MESLLNWRHWVLCTLLVAGLFATMLFFGDDQLPLSERAKADMCFAAIASACFYTLCKLTKKWEREGKIELPKIK